MAVSGCGVSMACVVLIPGQLNGQGWTRGGWEDAYATVEDPARLPLPCKATAIAQGRLHLLVLDSDNLIWEMRAWGKVSEGRGDLEKNRRPLTPGIPAHSPAAHRADPDWHQRTKASYQADRCRVGDECGSD